MTIDVQVALWGVGVIFLGGAMYADVRARLSRVEKMLGNGSPGLFVRRDEMAFRVKKADDEHDEFRDVDERLAERIEVLERRR